MFGYELELNIEQELSEIPPEYQDAFRQAIERELADSEQNRTDTDILTYLRQRRADFKSGGFIRPDGRPGLLALNPEVMYEQALPELTQSSLGEPDNTAERRRIFIKLGVFAGVVLLFLFFIFRGRAQREGEQAVTEVGTPVAMVSGEGTATDGTAAPTPPLPEITGIADSLQTIGSLGGALTIGRPSAIELHYGSNDHDGRTEETIALAIDPSKPTPKGEMRYNEVAMLSDNPVAVWLFGTVLNYAIGIPDSLVRNLEPGDRITLSTDTGASLDFVVAETRQGTNYEAGRALSQNRLGLTLFSLPASSENEVIFAFANYDIASEEEQGGQTYGIEEQISLPGGGHLKITAVQTSHDANGYIRIVVNGVANDLANAQTILLSLAANSVQTTAVQLMPDESGAWEVSFSLPQTVTGLALIGEVRTLPDGSLSMVQLGDVPNLTEQLTIGITGAWWDVAQAQVVLTGALTNTGEGEVYLGSDFIQIPIEGGDVNEGFGQVIPQLPTLIHPGETVGLTISFFPQSASVQLQLGADLWEVAGIPLATPGK